MKKLLICCAILALTGCEQLDNFLPPALKTKKPEPKQQAQEPSGMEDAVDTVVVQKGKIDAGRRAADRVRAISAQHEKDLNEAYGD